MAGQATPAIRVSLLATAAVMAAVVFLPGRVAAAGGLQGDRPQGVVSDTVRVTPGEPSCSPGVHEALRSAATLADGGGVPRALTLLAAELPGCPDHPALLLGLAGLHFRAGHLAEAEELAARLVRIEPESSDGRELLGVTRYLQDDVVGALRAWEPLGRPRLRDLDLRILSHDGRDRTSGVRDVQGTTGLRVDGVVTVERLARGERRLAALPAATRARLGVRALPEGAATVEGTVVLGAVNPFTRYGLAAHALRLLGRGIRVESMDRLGRLERWELAASLEGSLREAGVALSHPAPGALGVWRWEVAHRAGRYGPAKVPPEVNGAVEGGTGGTLPDDPVVRMASTRLSWRHDHWITASLRGSARTGVELQGTRGTFATGGVGWTVLPVDARGALGLEGLGWSRIGRSGEKHELRGEASRFGRLELLGSVQVLEPPVRSHWVAGRGTREGWSGGGTGSAGWSPVGVHVRGGLVAVTSGTPPDLRPRIGAGGQTDLLMRARGDLDGRGVVRSRYPGTAWAHAGVEVLRPMGSLGPVGVGVALFVDGVQAVGGGALPGGPSGPGARQGEVHLGAGVRSGVPWVEGWLRVDWAIDPADGASSLSMAWVRPHPLMALRAH
jgi:hypothetical protein